MLSGSNISKKYKGNDFYSLKNINFNIKEGEIVGLIGKNGAGKSTLLKIITKAIAPTTGVIKYNNQDIRAKNNVLDDFGILIETVFYPQLTVLENMNFYLEIHKKENCKTNIPATLKLVDLWESRNRKPGGFSFGMKQRMALALALVTEPNYLILDEPFTGLDPIGVKNLINILKKWSSNRKVSMLISSHRLNELESLCDRFMFIKNGQIKEYEKGDFGKYITITVNSNNKKIKDIIDESSQVQISSNTIKISDKIDNHEFNDLLNKLSKYDMIENIDTSSHNLSDYLDNKEDE